MRDLYIWLLILWLGPVVLKVFVKSVQLLNDHLDDNTQEYNWGSLASTFGLVLIWPILLFVKVIKSWLEYDY